MADTTLVDVPDTGGYEILVRWDGDDPTTYEITEGSVSVEQTHVDRFLVIVEGSATASGGIPAEGA